MRYMALACDYDGTLAMGGKVDSNTVEAVRRLKASGRLVVLVTGRELDDLQSVFPQLDLFDRVVAENGALLFRPVGRDSKLLATAPPGAFLDELGRRNVPFSVGRSIVATSKPHDTAVLAAIRDLGLELHVIFNKDAVMVLPSSINKAAGLRIALEDLHLSAHNAVAIGDAENDHALLRSVECGAAVANALPILKQQADLVTRADHGPGVVELIDHLLENDLADLGPRLSRHDLKLGLADDGREVAIPPYGPTILLAGPSGAGKSSLATAFLEQLTAKDYQFCLFDPEGDYEGFPGAVTLGGPDTKPDGQAVLELLEQPSPNGVVNLTGIAKEDRPRFFQQIFPRLTELRARTGRPHWIVLDEVHHLLPARGTAEATMPREFNSALMITLEPGKVSPAALVAVDTLLSVGDTAGETIRAFQRSVGDARDGVPHLRLPRGEAALWLRGDARLSLFRVRTPESEHRRHRRKYAEGQLEPERQFHFRGPNHRLNLRAQNLAQFVELAEGVDDDTWLYHLKHGDYSQWFSTVIKDRALADRARAIEGESHPSAERTRAEIKSAIAERYTV